MAGAATGSEEYGAGLHTAEEGVASMPLQPLGLKVCTCQHERQRHHDTRAAHRNNNNNDY